MKQARAFGLGALLVTQNPVDIDYKGLANAGTWFIGKMQTERDRSRVLSGLEGAIAESDGVTGASDYDAVIAGLQGREFLLHNVHADAPMVFNTRWVMSYLRGPLTRMQVRTLMDEAGKRGGSGEAGMSDVAASAQSDSRIQRVRRGDAGKRRGRAARLFSDTTHPRRRTAAALHARHD